MRARAEGPAAHRGPAAAGGAARARDARREPRMVLHVGPPKTGTTAIQEWLTRNAPALAARGLHYPAGLLRGAINSVPITYAHQCAGTRFDGEGTARLREQFAAFSARGQGDVILSAEHMAAAVIPISGRYEARRTPRRFPTVTERGETAQEAGPRLLRALERGAGRPVTVVLALRATSELKASGYSQTLKAFIGRRKASDALGGDDWRFDPRAALDVAREAGAEIAPIAYRSAGGDPIETRLVRAIGRPDLAGGERGGIVAAEQPNRSPGALAMIGVGHLFWLFERAATGLPREALMDLSARLRHRVLAVAPIEGDARLVIHTPREAAELRDWDAERWEAFVGIVPEADLAASLGPVEAPSLSPLSWHELDRADRAAVEAWLARATEAIAADPDLARRFPREAVLGIADTPTGPHSSVAAAAVAAQ